MACSLEMLCSRTKRSGCPVSGEVYSYASDAGLPWASANAARCSMYASTLGDGCGIVPHEHYECAAMSGCHGMQVLAT